MGGTFDPIHHGHLVAASEVAHRFGLQRVIFTPTGNPWHKDRTTTGGEDRYLMTVIATAADTRFEVSRVDIDREGPTYTVDTLRDLQDRDADTHPDEPAEWFFITGADALAEIVGWHDPDGIIARAHLVGVTRPGHHLADPGLPEGVVTLIEIPALAISSSDIRARVADGQPVDYLVPEGVARWIRKMGLYSQGRM
jgi:nicotinate-nucleotide adenylyltransferase